MLAACSGGPDSMALATALRAERWHAGAVVVDHGLRPEAAEQAGVTAAWLRAHWARPGRRHARDRGGGGRRARGRGARGALPRAVARGGRDGRGRGAPGPHPRRPGRDGAARPGPGVGRAEPRRDAAAAGASSTARCSTCRATWCAPRAAGRPGRRRPAQRRRPLHARPGAAQRCCRCSSASSVLGSPRPWRVRPTSPGPTPTPSASCADAAAWEPGATAPPTGAVAWSAADRPARRGPHGSCGLRWSAAGCPARVAQRAHVERVTRLVTDWRRPGRRSRSRAVSRRSATMAGSATRPTPTRDETDLQET